MPVISALGNGGILWIVTAGILICTKKYRKSGILILLCMLLGLLIGNLALKPLIARPRPCWIATEFPLLIDNPSDFSHPSGHTLSSFIAAFVLLKTDRRLGIPCHFSRSPDCLFTALSFCAFPHRYLRWNSACVADYIAIFIKSVTSIRYSLKIQQFLQHPGSRPESPRSGCCRCFPLQLSYCHGWCVR